MVGNRGRRMARLGKIGKIKRGEIWITDLRPSVGWEVAKIRPALIISNNNINNISPVVIVIPLSSQIPQVLGPERLLLQGRKGSLDKDSVILLTQIRTIDKSRLTKHIGKISQGKLLEVEDALKLVLGLISLEYLSNL